MSGKRRLEHLLEKPEGVKRGGGVRLIHDVRHSRELALSRTGFRRVFLGHRIPAHRQTADWLHEPAGFGGAPGAERPRCMMIGC